MTTGVGVIFSDFPACVLVIVMLCPLLLFLTREMIRNTISTMITTKARSAITRVAANSPLFTKADGQVGGESV